MPEYKTAYLKIIKPKSILKIGREKSLIIETDATFNKLQKLMWKMFFNINIEDIKEK